MTIHIHPSAYDNALPEQRREVRYDTTERDPEDGRTRLARVAAAGEPVWIVRTDHARQPRCLRLISAEELTDFSRLLPGMTAYALFCDLGDHLSRVLVSPVPLVSSVPTPPPFWTPPPSRLPATGKKGKRHGR